MPKAIQDEFTHLPVSSSRKQQLRHLRDGTCYRCGRTRAPAHQFCLRCLVRYREYCRRRHGWKRRLVTQVSLMEKLEAKGLPAEQLAVLVQKHKADLEARRKARLSQRRRDRLANGKCANCGKNGVVQGRTQCLKCLVASREYSRKRRGFKRRYPWAATYSLQGPEAAKILEVARAAAAKRKRQTIARLRRVQRERRLQRIREGLCVKCGKPAQGQKKCAACLVTQREESRQRTGAKRRFPGALSYRLQGPAGIKLLEEAGALAAQRPKDKAQPSHEAKPVAPRRPKP